MFIFLRSLPPLFLFSFLFYNKCRLVLSQADCFCLFCFFPSFFSPSCSYSAKFSDCLLLVSPVAAGALKVERSCLCYAKHLQSSPPPHSEKSKKKNISFFFFYSNYSNLNQKCERTPFFLFSGCVSSSKTRHLEVLSRTACARFFFTLTPAIIIFTLRVFQQNSTYPLSADTFRPADISFKTVAVSQR